MTLTLKAANQSWPLPYIMGEKLPRLSYISLKLTQFSCQWIQIHDFLNKWTTHIMIKNDLFWKWKKSKQRQKTNFEHFRKWLLHAISRGCWHTHASKREPCMPYIIHVWAHLDIIREKTLMVCTLWMLGHPYLFKRQNLVLHTPYLVDVTTPALFWDSQNQQVSQRQVS